MKQGKKSTKVSNNTFDIEVKRMDLYELHFSYTTDAYWKNKSIVKGVEYTLDRMKMINFTFLRLFKWKAYKRKEENEACDE